MTTIAKEDEKILWVILSFFSGIIYGLIISYLIK